MFPDTSVLLELPVSWGIDILVLSFAGTQSMLASKMLTESTFVRERCRPITLREGACLWVTCFVSVHVLDGKRL